MASGPNIAPRGFSVTTNPERFSDFPQKRYQKNTQPELLIFENQSNSSGNTVYSDPIIINPAEGFSVHVSPDTTGNVFVETAISPEAGFWNRVATISNGDYLSNDQKLSFIRIGLADGISNATVWVYRQYSTY